MKFRRIVFLSLMALAVGAAGCIVTSFMDYAMNPTLSPYYGIMFHEGLRGEATVIRDKYGIAHVTADNLNDIFFATGYAQAQDRMFQMDMFRHLIQGRLAEVVGDMKLGLDPHHGVTTVLAQDKNHRIIGFKYVSECAAEALRIYRPEVYTYLESFSDGVNAYIQDTGDDLPLEYKMLKFEPEPWEPKDIVALGRFVGWMLASNMDMELERWIFADKLGEDMTLKVWPPYRKSVPEMPTILPRSVVDFRNMIPVYKVDKDASPISRLPAPTKAVAALLRDLAAMREYDRIAPVPYASNNWVVGPQKSKSGKPILANDPHLAHMMPATFWQVHQQGAGLDVYGVTFPGMPFVVLGHNRHFAWGLTTSRADVQDIFVEKLDPSGEKYEYKGEWFPVTHRVEKLKCRTGLRGKVEDAGSIEVRLTRHGPIINDINPWLKDAPPMAMRWVAYDLTTDMDISQALMSSGSVEEFVSKATKLNPKEFTNELDTIMGCMTARSVDDFKVAIASHSIPNQNWVVVDDSGNFGYIAGGRVPIRPKGKSMYPVPGWTGEYDWVGFIPPEQLPQVWNPERGYVATANNRVVPPDDYPYVFSYSSVPGWRAMRIEQLLTEKEKLDARDMARIQNDVKQMQAVYMVPLLLDALKDDELTFYESVAATALRDWDFMSTADSVPATIFNTWKYNVTPMLLEDELGEELFAIYFDNSLHLVPVDDMIINGSPLFDNVNTPELETREDIFRAAFHKTVTDLKKKMGRNIGNWKWGEVHTIEFKHPLGAGPLAKYLNFGPEPHAGANHTVRNASHRADDFRTLGGPCLRHIVDMADVDGSLWVIDGGESGQWKSPHYSDGAAIWLRSEYIKPIMNLDEAAAESEGLLKLRPMPEK